MTDKRLIDATEVERVFNQWLGEADSLAEQEAIECCIAHIHDTPAVDPQKPARARKVGEGRKREDHHRGRLRQHVRVPGGSLRELRCCAFRSGLQGSRLELLPRMRVHHGGRDE